MRLLKLIIFLFIPAFAIGQEYDSETGKGKINKNFCLRGELGWNRSWLASLGASYVYCNVNRHVPVTLVTYAAAEVNLAGYRTPTAFYGYKAGVEFGNIIYAYGFEIRNLTDFAGGNHFIFMPKAGISLFGHASLFYGYNIFQGNNNIFGICHSQWSLSVNLDRKLFKETLVPGGGSRKKE